MTHRKGRQRITQHVDVCLDLFGIILYLNSFVHKMKKAAKIVSK
jgi:hypothetical protein